MANFEQIKEKVFATAGKVADKSVELAKVAGEKAKLVGRITKLKTEIAMEKDATRKNFTEIGKLYYEKFKSNPDPDMAQAIAEIEVSLETVIQKQKEIGSLKKDLADDFGETVEEVVDAVEDLAEDRVETEEEIIEDVTSE